MRTYLTAFFMSVGCGCLVWILLFYSLLGSPVSRSQWIHDAYQIKDEAAFDITGPKVVFVSGSNVLFGIDSRQLSVYWDRPVVNYGVHAGLGLAYTLERSKQVLESGDIAILPLEYEFFQEEHDYSETLLIQMTANDPDYFYALPVVEKVRVMGKMPLKRLRKGLKSAFREKPREEDGGGSVAGNDSIYSIENINADGDQINLEPEKLGVRDRNRIARLKAVKLLTPEISDYSREIFSDYLAWARANDVCLIVMPSNHVYFDAYRGPVYSDFLYNIRDYFMESRVPYIGDPYDYMYEKPYYFGDRYHLNSQGVEKRTRQIMQDTGSDLAALCESYRQ